MGKEKTIKITVLLGDNEKIIELNLSPCYFYLCVV